MTCPVCGGAARKQLAPNFFECETERLTGVAPGPGAGVPVYAYCGHRYQEGAAHLDVLCACGMGAVGACKQCGKSICGTHGAMYDGRFLCGTHWHETDRHAKAVVARRADDELRTRRAAERDAEERTHAKVPGFPRESADGFELRAALSNLVPDRVQTITLERRGRLRATHATGWLLVARGQRSSEPNNAGVHTVSWSGWFVSVDGDLWTATSHTVAEKFDLDYLLQGRWPMFQFRRANSGHRLAGAELRTLRQRVIAWRA